MLWNRSSFRYNPSLGQGFPIRVNGVHRAVAGRGDASVDRRDSYDNALVESINGLYKSEVIHLKSWKNHTEVELATLAWVDWFNNRWLLERLGHISSAEAEKAYYASIGNKDLAA